MEARVAVLAEIARRNEKLLQKMDARMEKMEDRQHSDFKWLLSLGIGATALLLATMAHGFRWF